MVCYKRPKKNENVVLVPYHGVSEFISWRTNYYKIMLLMNFTNRKTKLVEQYVVVKLSYWGEKFIEAYVKDGNAVV